MSRTLLIVDDIRSNREILKKILGGEYAIIEAANGREAVALMERGYERISAVLLDLGMPVMDGFEVLSYMRASETLSMLPVIVTTGQTEAESEVKALELGANDYISKPYNSIIIKQRIRNTIKLRETAATVNALRRDRLTGLFSRETFFEKAGELVRAREAGYYVMASFDIDKFKVINDQYGTQKGDAVLRHIASVFSEGFERQGGLCCRVSGDDFAALYPASFQDSEELAEIRRKASTVEGLVSALTFSIGRYLITDLSLSPSAMYDRATLASESIKGRYDAQIAYYDESMRAQLIHEQTIVTQMASALAEGQFETWYQPQYNHSTGALIGAEALVRWRHPERGLVPPSAFVPVFEQNGFIYELDKYVWEDVCRRLRKWMDEGRAPLPVSVNISRFDILREDLTQVITNLIARYGVPVDMLRLEITESAFADATWRIVDVVKRLIDYGFTVEIDDFGSGYSSFNTLKNVPAQVLKLDMRFLQDDRGDAQRSGNIIESIVRMTKWLGMSVIAEGVEEKAQADFLRSIGCNYVQGYLYAKPMPAEQYEALCERAQKEEKLLTLETVENLDNSAFWNPRSLDSLIFNSYVGCACIFEYHQNRVELLRATQKYAQMIGSAGLSIERALTLSWTDYLDAPSRARLEGDLAASIATRGEVTGEYVFLDLPGCPRETYLRSTLRVIASTGERYLVYCSSENITAQRKAERGEHMLAEQMRAILDNVDLGVTATVFENGGVRYLLANDKYYSMLGYTRAQFEAEVKDPYLTIAPEYRELVRDTVGEIARTGKPAVPTYRGVRRDGSAIWLRSAISMGRFAGVDAPVQLALFRDITRERRAEMVLRDTDERLKALANSIPGGIATYEYDGETPRITYFNDGFCRLFELTRAEYANIGAKDALAGVFADDLPALREQLALLWRDGTPVDCVYRVRLRGGKRKWINLKAEPSRRANDKLVFNAVLFDVTRRQDALEKLRVSEEENRLATQHTGSTICRYRLADRVLTLPEHRTKVFGLSDRVEDVPYAPVREGLISPETAKTYIAFYEGILRGRKSGEATYQRKAPDGWRWLEAHYSALPSASGKPESAVISFRDVTDRVQKEAVFTKWRQSLQARKPEDFTLYRCGVRSSTFFATEEGELLRARFPAGPFNFDERSEQYAQQSVAEEDRPRFLAFLRSDALLAGYYGGKRGDSLEYREILPCGGYRWLRLSVELVEYPGASEVEAYMMFENIDESKRAALDTLERAQTDPLTGVLNRAAFSAGVERALRVPPSEAHSALLMMDIDGFKQVNDAFGHAVGDNTLKELAVSLRKALRPGDLLGRLGGDEFVIFLPDAPDAAAVAAVARRVCLMTLKSFSVEVQISASVGVALCPKDGRDFDALYKRADDALYYVKGSGKNHYAFYHDDMADEHLDLEREEAKAGEKKRRMLIVDDNRIDHAMLSNLFASSFIVEKASDGNTALIRLRHYGAAISVVLLDLFMPGMDGFAVLKRMRESAELRSIPVIVVSGADDRETSLRAIREGASDFVTKPVDPELLRIRVQSAVSKAENERLRAQNCVLEAQSDEVTRYKTVLEHSGVSVIEYDLATDSFVYDPALGKSLAGVYDRRKLWHILLSDMVTDTQTARRMQELVASVSGQHRKAEETILVPLKTPAKKTHWFSFTAFRTAGESPAAGKTYLTLYDAGENPPGKP